MKSLFRTLVFLSALLAGTAFAGPVNINTADAATLAKELTGVGDVTAAAIVAYREEHGPFQSADELTKVKGVGAKTVEKNRDNIRLSDQ